MRRGKERIFFKEKYIEWNYGKFLRTSLSIRLINNPKTSNKIEYANKDQQVYISPPNPRNKRPRTTHQGKTSQKSSKPSTQSNNKQKGAFQKRKKTPKEPKITQIHKKTVTISQKPETCRFKISSIIKQQRKGENDTIDAHKIVLETKQEIHGREK